ncbi:phage major capsid protein [Massilimaliae timonensis]|jgi:HK97 family phage major capsid protein|uniref:Phage major capsid protein n=1 Tax=Massiliimalia timonensis TaxID=1987501 RepID=A0A8J6P3N1_9FIRM|nr:phage major capsid protein [Massiliimalia timonensis]MBC8612081.1 phage major capsid protein [Massiliimalia timonensis]
MNRIEEIDKRLSEIKAELDGDCDVDALEKEVRGLKEERKTLMDMLEKRKQLQNEVANGAGEVIRGFKPETEEKRYDASSPEYKTAWLKNMAMDSRGKKLFGDLTKEERAAFTFTTANTGEVVPTEIMNRIVSLVDNDSPMYDDSFKSNLVYGFEIPRLKSIDAGDAKNVTEGVANDDEQDTFDSIALPGVEIKKHIVMSRKMQFQSIQAFEDWVVTHLAERIRVAKETYILSQLAKSGTVGIDSGNVISAAACTDEEIRKALGLLRGSGERVLYANSNFIWNTLAGLETTEGDKLFIPNPMADPLVEGRVYGTAVKRDSNIPDDTFYIGYPKKILSNEFILFDITPQIEDKTLNRIFVGYSLFDAGLEDPKAFVKWSKSGG